MDKLIVDKIARAFNTGDVSHVDSIFSTNYIDHQRPDFITVDGPEEFKQIVTLARKSLPNLLVTIKELKIESDKFIVRFHWHSKDNNGKEIDRETRETLKIVDSQVVEHWGEEIWSSMNDFHTNLLHQLRKYAGKGTAHSGSDSYLSSSHYYYSVSVPLKRKIALEWVKEYKDIEVAELLSLLNALFTGKSYEEKTIAGILLGYLPKQRKEINPELLDVWLNNLVGWAEIDTLCQGTYTGKEVREKWDVWKSLIKKFSKDKNISKRRAALVLLTGPVSNSDSKKLETLAFEIIDTVKNEKDILITKAISWLLRSLVKFHKEDVRKYVKANENLLPKIAVRETMKKIKTGRK